MPEGLKIGDREIAPGERTTVTLPVSRRYTHGESALPVHVVNGRQPGPRLFLCAAVHGDEIVGVEVIRRLLRLRLLRRIRGALLAVPVVNIHGFVERSRYLPDRRDLNRSFPGSPRGSLAARLAHQFMTQVVRNATHGLDLHTGSLHRENLPHIRACLDQPETARLARAFGTPVVLNADLRDGSLRQAVRELDLPVLVYEGGEALRFDELAVRTGVRGVVSVMRALGMLREGRAPRRSYEPVVARSATWLRAPEGGILRTRVRLGARVEEGSVLGVVSDPLGEGETPLESPVSGVVIGRLNLPLVNEGDAVFHVATFDRLGQVAAQLEQFLEPPEPGEGEPGLPG